MSLQQYYLRARYYDQANGQFTSLDPYRGNLYDPQSLHKYAYCHNEPVNSVDPSGETALIELLVVMVLITVNAVIWGTYSIRRVWGPGGRMPTAAEQVQIDAARNYITLHIVGITLTELTTEPSVTVPATFGTFNKYRVGEEMGVWAKAPPLPRNIVLLNKSRSIAESWFSLPVDQGAVIAVHELFHQHWWTPGAIEENEAWEITAHLWHELGLPHSGSLFLDIEEMSDQYGFPLPW